MSRNGLRINYICPLPSLAGGVKSTRLICEAMVRRGHVVNVVFPMRLRPLPSWWRARALVRELRQRVSYSASLREHHLQRSTANLIPVDSHMVQSDDAPDADITIASWWATVEQIMTWPDSKGVKVHYIRGHEAFHHQKSRVEAVYRSNLPKITNSHWLRGIVKAEYGREAVVVHNGVDRTQFDAPARERGHPPVVGFLYSPGPVKGAATAIQACRRVQERIPELRVVAFGAMEVERGTEVPNNFEFRLRPPQDQIAPLYSRADCWLIPSASEGLPMPGLEAAACRCPLVATECGGVADFVREGVNGHLVPVGDWQAMADRIERLLTRPAVEWRRMSSASHDIAREFDWDRSAELLEAFLLTLLPGRVVVAS